MKPIEIRPGIYWVGVDDRVTDLFEGLWPISQVGVSYNAYLVKDEKTALIDLSKEMLSDDYLSQLSAVVDLASVDYVVINHMEPDHSGALKRMLEFAPNAQILGMPKAIDMLKDFYGLEENTTRLSNNQELSLGKYTLRFVYTPLVHWPETMMTYLVEEGILFSCDGFGGYGALDGGVFDDDYADLAFFETEALRYFSNIVAAFSKSVLSALKKFVDMPIRMIAPSHGLIWRADPARIIDLYRTWSEYHLNPAEVGITILFGTMYRNTEHALNAALQGIAAQGVPVSVHDVRKTHVSYILPDLWTQRGVLVAAPTYEGKLFPTAMDVLMMADRKHIANKTAAYLGSKAWSGGAQADFARIAEKLGWQVLNSMDFLGGPTQEDLVRAREIGAQLARAVKSTA
ncbi:MAG TPA: FprA family A-type flavoprotein [Brevefilum fermentans]|jgi:anaerobic nitric oxide reductase flavorubredoxin|nr:FprA family A-type flavoprotein [Brevefilum fermentans]